LIKRKVVLIDNADIVGGARHDRGIDDGGPKSVVYGPADRIRRLAGGVEEINLVVSVIRQPAPLSGSSS
jgi:hypothetical protein